MPNDYFPTGPFLSRLPDRGAFDRSREDFLLECRSERTARAYRADLEHFWEWCDIQRIAVLQPGVETIERYLLTLAADGYGTSTISRRGAAVRGFLRHLRRD